MNKTLTTAQLRDRFLRFFEAKQHPVRPSDLLTPANDPTVLFTSAGMNQFKEYFLGRRKDLQRAASVQKCLRTGDMENVGKTPSHHSFFEMLGNFSFGDYFKAEAILWAWEFLTGTLDYEGTQPSQNPELCLSLPPQKLWVSVYEEDDEAAELWVKLGVPKDRIVRFGQKDNFWPANAPSEGPNGPCGPCSEIYFDSDGKVDSPKSVEVWNLVFTQYDRQEDGSLNPLPRKNIDTGMGLERLATVVQGVSSDYETDGFVPLVKAVRDLDRGSKTKKDREWFALHAVADHIRAITFLIADGVLPTNEGRGYVLRMLIRRAYRLGRSVLDIQPNDDGTFLVNLVPQVLEVMRESPYIEDLKAKKAQVLEALGDEERQFVQTLESGGQLLAAKIEEFKQSGNKEFPGEEAFKLYDTFGFPFELTEDAVTEQGMTLAREGFEKALKAQQERSRAKSQFGGGIFVGESLTIRDALTGMGTKDEQFLGYDRLSAQTQIRGIWDGKAWVETARAGQQVGLVFEQSPFYGESGGQAGDTGVINAPCGTASVGQTTWIDEVLFHHAVIDEGEVKLNDTIEAHVDPQRRLKVARAHTSTHLLHWALREVLGPGTGQAGSSNVDNKLRFDFTAKQVSDKQVRQIEDLVNARVAQADAVSAQIMSLREAKESGAIAMFGEKYGDQVRVITIGDYSKEFCGGTHLPHIGYIGSFKIVGESSISAGTRRVEALVGEAANEVAKQESQALKDAAKVLGRPVKEVVTGIGELQQALKTSEKTRLALQAEIAALKAQTLTQNALSIGEVRLVAQEVPATDRDALKLMADAMRDSMGQNAIVLLATQPESQSVAWVMAATKDLAKRIHVGKALKSIAAITGGGGGGRPDFAQAGGKDPQKIGEALKQAESIVKEALGG